MKQSLIALDQLANTLCWFLPGGCWADETLSARAWRIRHVPGWGRWHRVIDTIFFLQPDHCEESYLSELLRYQLPAEFRV
jgi:hypothetical protein